SFIADRLVQIKDRDGILTRGRAAKSEVGDIHAQITQRPAKRTDDTRHIPVAGIKHMLAHFGIDIDPADLDEARLAVTEYRARDGTLTLGGHDSQLDIALEHTGL